jgi:AAA family ATP:ADP antiporter
MDASMKSEPPDAKRRGLLERSLSIVTELRAGEGPDALLLTSSIFVCLVAYYILKVIREPLVLASGGAVEKAYATGVQAVVMLLAVPVYAALAKRADPRRLLIGVTLSVVVLLEAFAWLADTRLAWVGFAFYVLAGIVGVLFVSQFWSFANDLVDEARGERIFPLVALGASAGSWFGSELSARLIEWGVGVPTLLRIAAGTLVVHALAYALIDRRATQHEDRMSRPSIAPSEDGLRLVMRSPYLRVFAAMIVLLNLVNTNSEFMLSNAIASRVEALDPIARRAEIGARFGHFYGGVNLVSFLLQALVVGRVARYGGVRATLLVLPVVSLVTSVGVASGVAFAIFRVTKTLENACDYSLTNTARALLWLPTTRDEKYKAKQTIDTVFTRFGDVLSMMAVQFLFVFAGESIARFALFNVAFGVVSLGVVVYLLGERRRLTPRA